MTFDLNTGILTVIMALLVWIKADLVSVWKRVNNHTHVIECNDKDCNVKMNGVVVRGE
jgi:hypothetical protein